jgi:hypothetical protein
MHPKEQDPLAYSGYTVYTGTCQFTGKLTDTTKIGYQVCARCEVPDARSLKVAQCFLKDAQCSLKDA